MSSSDKPNIIFLLVDNMRFDTFEPGDEARARTICPNIMSLIDDGFVRPVISNGHATKFAMPSLFSQIYPLDKGGYNNVVQNTERTFAEDLQAAGYKTFMYQGDDNDGPVSMCDRGFDEVESIYDMRLLLQNYLEEVLIYEATLWRQGEVSDEEIGTFLRDNFKPLIVHMASSTNRVPAGRLPARLSALTPYWAKKFRAEADLIERDPVAVARKILATPPHFYYITLGQERSEGLGYLYARVVFRIFGALQARLHRSGLFPFRYLTFRRSPLGKELMGSLLNKIDAQLPGPWMGYAHLMDLHDRRLINRPIRVLKKLLWSRTWKKVARPGDSVFRFLYDASLHLLDQDVGELIAALKKQGLYDKTVFFITGDHGCEMIDAALRGRNEEFGYRNHPEHITVPLICGPMKREPCDEGLHDLMSVTATVMDVAGVTQHSSYLGVSHFARGRAYVITENAGRGNADLARKDLHFTVTTLGAKLMSRIRDKTLYVERLYLTDEDPTELNNVISEPGHADTIEPMLDHLFAARRTIFAMRHITREGVVLGDAPQQ